VKPTVANFKIIFAYALGRNRQKRGKREDDGYKRVTSKIY
jgi:hypothetical protein